MNRGRDAIRTKFAGLVSVLICTLLLAGCGGAGSHGAGGSGGSASGVPAAVTEASAASGERGASSGGSLAPGEAPELSVPQPPAILTGDSLRMTWMAAHYWDNLDWGDGRWIADTAALEGYFTSWAQLLAQMPESEAARLSGALFRKGNDHPDMQLRLLDAAEYFWRHPNSPFRSEELFIPALEAIVRAPGIADIYKVRPRSQLASALKNRPGMRAADFAYTMGSGAIARLSGLRAEYLLLMFYNPGCHDCARVEEHIVRSEVFAPLIASGRLRVLAIYPDDDVEAWRSHLPQMPAGWTVGHAPMEKGGTAAYDLPGIPALYLLGRDKTVLVKDRPVDVIEDWLAQHADGK